MLSHLIFISQELKTIINLKINIQTGGMDN